MQPAVNNNNVYGGNAFQPQQQYQNHQPLQQQQLQLLQQQQQQLQQQQQPYAQTTQAYYQQPMTSYPYQQQPQQQQQLQQLQQPSYYTTQPIQPMQQQDPSNFYIPPNFGQSVPPQPKHPPVDASTLLKSGSVRKVACPVCHKTIEGDDPAINHHVNEHYS
ncbi:hypothetical protein DFQ28_007949 [Apophysomyces sp. BC1034]|nr:hypothetical protein DFQ30_007724 [Apophysomyces sp. BC1015]KAG0175927.1 hypothetical protein DFQ29_006791 [Apophysomyces sp. BC1021]KAG0186371.1 hypothetical protein DFQ28_007949 [Apophysomyces sp. BC1034]